MFVPKRRKREYRSNWLDTAKNDRQLLGLKCEKCGSTDKVQRHHIVHKSKGGSDALINLQLLCHYCHLRAHNKLPRKR